MSECSMEAEEGVEQQHRRQEEEALECDEMISNIEETSENPCRRQCTREGAGERRREGCMTGRRRLRSAATVMLCASALLCPVGSCDAFIAGPFGGRVGLAQQSRKSQAAVAAATVTVTEAVRKRRGDFLPTTADVAVAKAKVARASPKQRNNHGLASVGSVGSLSKKVAKKQKKKKIVQVVDPPVVLAAVAASQPHKKKAALAAAAKVAVKEMALQTEEAPVFGRNVFHTFSASYTQSSLEFVESTATTTPHTPNASTNANAKKPHNNEDNGINHKIARLLVDDEGEEDDLAPDDSPEAANQLADRASSAKMSDEAKFKASVAVKKRNQIAPDSIHHHVPSTNSDQDIAIINNDNNNDSTAKHADQEDATARATAKNKGKISRKEYIILEEKRQNRQRKPRKGKTVTATVSETGSDTMGSYAKSMANHELLRKEDEVVLGRQIQILVKWEEERQKLEDELNRPPTFAQWADKLNTTVPLLKKQIRRSHRAKAAFIEANLRLVVTVARQTVKKNRSEISFQDACQEGIIGLTRACEKFDPERGFRFSTYAIWWVKKEIHKSVVEQSRTVRLPANAMKKINDIRINERVLMDELGRRPKDEEVAEKCGLTVERLQFYRNAARDVTSLDKSIEARQGKGSSASGENSNKGTSMADLNAKDTSPSPTDLAASQMLREDVRRLIKTLSPKEQAVIRLRFGIDDGRPRTLDDIGKKFSVEKERVRKIEARALLKLRQPYRNQSVKAYISDL